MSPQTFKRILIVALCTIALVAASFVSMRTPDDAVCKEGEAPAQNTAGPQLIWETLSRQFLSSVHY
jgi:hypothetical protein